MYRNFGKRRRSRLISFRKNNCHLFLYIMSESNDKKQCRAELKCQKTQSSIGSGLPTYAYMYFGGVADRQMPVQYVDSVKRAHLGPYWTQ